MNIYANIIYNYKLLGFETWWKTRFLFALLKKKSLKMIKGQNSGKSVMKLIQFCILHVREIDFVNF